MLQKQSHTRQGISLILLQYKCAAGHRNGIKTGIHHTLSYICTPHPNAIAHVQNAGGMRENMLKK